MGSAVDFGAYEFQGLGPVYRFWSPTEGRHFYTISATERDQYLAHPKDWQLEGVAFYAFYVPVAANLLPVYRVVSSKWTRTFTPSAKTNVSRSSRIGRTTGPTRAWPSTPIRPAASPSARCPSTASGRITLARTFIQIDEDEKNRVVQNYPSIWQLEVIAWYAYAQPHPPDSAGLQLHGRSSRSVVYPHAQCHG